MAKQDDYTKTALRLPRDLHQMLVESAAARGHSLNTEMVYRLEQSFVNQAESEANIQTADLLAENRKLRVEMTKLRNSVRIRSGASDRIWQADSMAGTSLAAPKLLHQMMEVTEETEKLRKEVGEVLEIVKNAMTPDELKRRFGRGPQYDEPATQQTEASKPATKRVTRSKKSQP
ncbi:hypothetical protein WR30_11225 [Burkholderia contaminans FFH2055]|uniref:Arc family DNA-binding protein n=1 Tax=Burkholderia contaminans TaxID=488447 RepID=UPI0006266FB1|nr:Arc family DNA-binding protein [Burkholderia contaminans]KKL38622.1 hypothetical protein WR30_11225 [Burkholderia contaminans FFH2055]MEB4631170.1 Arc family DNA-binding protein [Burkholderia contaminans]MEB4637982.1 Arc family DNA-binding protein [Burkholderia contaminans]MEB4653066.1 Arc family DNA-binding protein [Burkholderia contaminans]MEB4658102.1 Arc family DNA-binding protein [Burkholderia contaminans]